MNRELALKVGIGAFAVVVIGVGGYIFLKTQGIKTLTQAFEKNLESGNYLAALGAAGTLRAEGEATPELEERIAEAARFLVAEDAYNKAKVALDEERYDDASAFLKGSPAITDETFKYFEEATRVYEEAEALAAGIAHKTNVTISTLAEKAKSEAAKNSALQKKSSVLEGTVKVQQQAIAAQDAVVTETKKKLEESKKESDARQAELVAEQARAKALMEAVAKESKQKFVNEIKVYRDMALRGKTELDNTIIEINGNRDVTALIYISQGKVLFEEAKKKADDLRNRNKSSYVGVMGSLESALDAFLDSGKDLRNAVVYMEDKGSSNFTESFSQGKTKFTNAVAFLSTVSAFINSNQ